MSYILTFHKLKKWLSSATKIDNRYNKQVVLGLKSPGIGEMRIKMTMRSQFPLISVVSEP